jgi:hypothetical protein
MKEVGEEDNEFGENFLTECRINIVYNIMKNKQFIAVSRLKPGKHNGYIGLSSDHVKDASVTLTSGLYTPLYCRRL